MCLSVCLSSPWKPSDDGSYDVTPVWQQLTAASHVLWLVAEKYPSDHLATSVVVSLHDVYLLEADGSLAVKNFPAFYGTRMFVTALTSSATCPCPEPDQPSPCPHPTS